MSRKSKIIAAAAALTAVTALGAYAIAQGGPGMGHGRMGGMGGMGHGKMGQGPGSMMGNMGDPAARLETIKTELGIKPNQTAAWDSYSKTVTETAAERRSHREKVDRDAVQKMDPKDRQAFRDSMRGDHEKAAGKVKTAAETLLAQLDDSQKEKARRTLPGLVTGGQGEGMRQGMMGKGGGDGMGRGPGPRHNH